MQSSLQIILITTSKLSSILNDPDLILVDTRSFKEYAEGHIPGAVHLDLFAFHWIETTERGIDSFNSQGPESSFNSWGDSGKKSRLL